MLINSMVKRTLYILLRQKTRMKVFATVSRTGIEMLELENKVLGILRRAVIKAPQVIARGETSLLMEYIPGKTLLEIYSNEGLLNKKSSLQPSTYQIIDSLCNWLKNFYIITRKEFGYQAILGDPNFRNFIFNQELFGIDFEEVHQGDIEEDIGRLCAFALTYDPPLTKWKHRFVDCLTAKITTEMHLDRKSISRYVVKIVEEVDTRRRWK